ncbi:MAG: hypothetical protein HKN31_03235 [Pricia sp.]|nr:hypothetical protein [Pricia sp.]
MKHSLFIGLWILGIVLIPLKIHAQEAPEIEVQESAEVSLEDYSDEFQENFFEALKHKGIENYDKAINFLLECKHLDPSNRVIDHELAKVYLKDKQYPLAEEYALTSLKAEPKNYWYAHTLIEILQKQGKSIEGMKNELPISNMEFNENVALIYFKQKNYETALAILKESKNSDFAAQLSAKINDSIEKQEAVVTNNSLTVESNDITESNTLEEYKIEIQELINSASIPQLEELSEEALESYPLQPYFYYAHGYALSKKAKYQEAIETMETGLDYLVGDIALANKFYQELSDAYASINNSVKANMYLRKIKPGF